MKKLLICSIIALICAFVGCSQRQTELSQKDKNLVSVTGIPEPILLKMKQAGENIRQFEPEGYNSDSSNELPSGITINVKYTKSVATVHQLQESVGLEYFVFISERNYGMHGNPDHITLLKTSDPYDALRIMQTNGTNYDIDTDTLIARLKEWDKRFGIKIQGASGDWVEAEFIHQPTDMMEFAKEVYKFCPDVVDQGTETVEKLASEMKDNNTLYLWWD